MQRSAVSFVLRESVTRIQVIGESHARVPTDFGHYRCGTDGRHRGITANDCPSVNAPAADVEMWQAIAGDLYKRRPQT